MDFNGKALPTGDEPDALRVLLESYSDRPFAPANYKVWRNYKRVFGCQLLATEINGVLHATDLCKGIAQEKISADEYLINLAKRFSYSSPVFEDYDPSDQRIFPVCAIVKFLAAKYLFKKEAFVSLDQIINYVKGNQLTGEESVEFYSKLKPTGYSIDPADDEYRQIRELIRFISQLSFLKWENPNVFLDVSSSEEAYRVAAIFEPQKSARKNERAYEVLRLGLMDESIPEIITGEKYETDPQDLEFSEGKKLRISHMRTERSGKLRELYYKHTIDPNHCNMCAMDTQKKYPWTTRVLELHHLLPLASPIRVEKNSSSLKDIVGLCPSCHRATHKYYSKWFKDTGLTDFRDSNEAKDVYIQAKNEIVI